MRLDEIVWDSEDPSGRYAKIKKDVLVFDIHGVWHIYDWHGSANGDIYSDLDAITAQAVLFKIFKPKKEKHDV